jgi:ribosomal protein L12E/L44/L45/RPP1/RPP2
VVGFEAALANGSVVGIVGVEVASLVDMVGSGSVVVGSADTVDSDSKDRVAEVGVVGEVVDTVAVNMEEAVVDVVVVGMEDKFVGEVVVELAWLVPVGNIVASPETAQGPAGSG